MGYRPWGHKESDRTEQLTLSLPLSASAHRRKSRAVLPSIKPLASLLRPI